jgi:threonine/homoserine/homoserine lactone efflux protein
LNAIHDLPLFMAAALLLNLTPGPDMLYVLGTSSARGARAGVAAALGIGAGCAVHIALGALGVSALIAASPLAFSILKGAGAGYLVWAGVSMLRTRTKPGDAVARPATPARRVFWQGALINALNPKVALFFLALLPQFIDAHAGAGQASAFLALGVLFDTSGTLVNIAVALAAGWLGTSGAARRCGAWLDRAAGGLFVALGVKLAFDAHR